VSARATPPPTQPPAPRVPLAVSSPGIDAHPRSAKLNSSSALLRRGGRENTRNRTKREGGGACRTLTELEQGAGTNVPASSHQEEERDKVTIIPVQHAFCSKSWSGAEKMRNKGGDNRGRKGEEEGVGQSMRATRCATQSPLRIKSAFDAEQLTIKTQFRTRRGSERNFDEIGRREGRIQVRAPSCGTHVTHGCSPSGAAVSAARPAAPSGERAAKGELAPPPPRG
jgi:hypothetical protein